MARASGDLRPCDDLKAVVTISSPVQRFQRTFQEIVVGDGDEVEIGLGLNVLQDLGNAGETVPGRGVDVEICLPHFSLSPPRWDHPLATGA